MPGGFPRSNPLRSELHKRNLLPKREQAGPLSPNALPQTEAVQGRQLDSGNAGRQSSGGREGSSATVTLARVRPAAGDPSLTCLRSGAHFPSAPALRCPDPRRGFPVFRRGCCQLPDQRLPAASSGGACEALGYGFRRTSIPCAQAPSPRRVAATFSCPARSRGRTDPFCPRVLPVQPIQRAIR